MNGVTQNVFEIPGSNASGGTHAIDCTGKHIGKIGIYIHKDFITGICFYNRDGTTLFYTAPSGHGCTRSDTRYEDREFPEGEELVGVYGISSLATKCSAIGYMTRRI